MTALRPALEVALRAADAARTILLAECARPDGPRGEIGKCPADDEAELAIRSILLSTFPDWGFLGEETGFSPPRGSTQSNVWVVDPNDGTTPMQRGYRGHAVSIALLRDRLPVLAVVWAVDAPDDRGDLFTWAEGCGPILRNEVAVPAPTWAPELGPNDVVGVSQAATRNPVGYAPAVAPARFMGLPSIAYRLALVAVGENVATLSLNSLQEWDYAAGHALLRAAGGTLLNGTGEEIRYSGNGAAPATRVFGGGHAVVRQLLGRHWENLSRTGFGPSAPPPDIYPIRPQAGHLVHDSDVLSRAQGCLLGQLAGDWATGQPGPHAEEALLLARALILDQPLPEFTANSAAPLGIAGRQLDSASAAPLGIAGRQFDSAFTATLSAAIRDRLDVRTARSFAREWAARHAAEIPNALAAALSQLPSLETPLSGALTGAIYGRQAIPGPLQRQILTSRSPSRTAEYWPTDAMVIAERLLTLPNSPGDYPGEDR